MSTFVKNNLKLTGQGITGHRTWHYSDTGAIADVVDVAGYFAQAGNMGVKTGDLILISATDGTNSLITYGAGVSVSQDTGATQVTVGPSTVLGDTG